MPHRRMTDGAARTDLIKNTPTRDLKELFNALLSAKSQLDSGGSDQESQDEGLDDYEYQPLGKPTSIRLLKLRMARKRSKEIECELFEEDLTCEPQYEALSWSWGGESWDRSIRILRGGTAYRFDVPRTLVAALKALRFEREHRILWIDAICINQKNSDEKNRQVPMMSQIYGQATGVCVWIGEENQHSKIAIDFIRDEVLRLQDFDELCENEEASPKWRAMLDVMKSSWFSRRWVVQEIALANEATIYCGDQTISWKDFSDAVQLFVEVESATHRLSEVMKKDPQFFHVPGWFEYVSALGASLLVNATGTLFRKTRDQRKEPLLSLEYLVSSMTVFQATVAHDTIYSLLAIARDTQPVPVIRDHSQASDVPAQKQLTGWAFKHAIRKPYDVDYQKPLIDVCQEFIAFCIQQSDPTRALDIICRPWAPVLDTSRQKELEKKKSKGHKEPRHIEVNEEFDVMPSWVPTLAGAAHAIHQHATGELKMGRQNADPLVGLPDYTQRNYSAAGTKEMDKFGLRFKKYKDKNYYSMSVTGFVCDEVAKVLYRSQSGNIPKEWIKEAGWDDFSEDPPDELWRTLVGDRGRNGRNPPTYYARACKESIHKGLASGSLNTTELIEHGRCSVVSEFFRRVQAVIWNRCLMRTEQGPLGIVNENVRRGDLICVLYGCSVPVILRRHEKDQEMVDYEDREFQRDREATTIKLQRIYKESRERKKLRMANDPKKSIKERRSLTRASTFGSIDTLSDPSQLQDLPESERQAVLSSRSATSNFKEEQPALEKDHEGFDRPDGFESTVEFLALAEDQRTDATQGLTRPSKPPKPANLSGQYEMPVLNADDPDSKVLTNGAPYDEYDNIALGHNNTYEVQDEEPTEELKRVSSKAARRKYWYEFVGECYVHGMMDGEAIKYQNENRVPAEMFELR